MICISRNFRLYDFCGRVRIIACSTTFNQPVAKFHLTLFFVAIRCATIIILFGNDVLNVTIFPFGHVD